MCQAGYNFFLSALFLATSRSAYTILIYEETDTSLSMFSIPKKLISREMLPVVQFRDYRRSGPVHLAYNYRHCTRGVNTQVCIASLNEITEDHYVWLMTRHSWFGEISRGRRFLLDAAT